MSTGSDRPEEEGHDDGGMMRMMAAMMAICVGVLTLVLVLPTLGLPGALGLAIALGAVMLIGHRLFMHPGGHRH
jgi:hypothetical protein